MPYTGCGALPPTELSSLSLEGQALADDEDPQSWTITADQAVELREAKERLLLLVDTAGGAGGRHLARHRR